MSDPLCVICCGDLIDTSFDEKNPQTLCRLLGLPQAPVKIEGEEDEQCFADLFISATYCKPCVGEIVEISQLFDELDELGRNLETRRQNIERRLKKSLDMSLGNDSLILGVEKEEDFDTNCGQRRVNQNVRREVVEYLDKTSTSKSPKKSISHWQLTPEEPVSGLLEIGSAETEGTGRSLVDDCNGFIVPDLVHDSAILDEKLFSMAESEAEALNFASSRTLMNPADAAEPVVPVSDQIQGVQKPVSASSSRVQLRKRKNSLKLEPEPPLKHRKMAYQLGSKKFRIRSRPHKADKQGPGTSDVAKERQVFCSYPGCHISFKVSEEHRRQAHFRRVHEGIKDCFLCFTCGLFFPDLKKWTRDQQKHAGVRVPSEFVCTYCQLDFETAKILQIHVKKAHEPGEPTEFPCSECDKVLATRRLLYSHRRNHKKKVVVEDANTSFPCKDCDEVFATRVKLQNHRRKHSTNPDGTLKTEFPCKDCDQVFGTRNKLQVHRVKNHSNYWAAVDSGFPCKDCDKVFGTRMLLHSHRRKHSSKYGAKGAGENTTFPCKDCDEVFRTRNQLQSHRLKHRKDSKLPIKPRIECEICKETFANEVLFNYHHRMKHEKVSKDFKCTTCGKQLSNLRYLDVHVQRYHTNVWKLICDICGRGAQSPSELATHKAAVHSEARPFVCQLCPADYKTKRALELHARSHTGERPYLCKHCGKGFVILHQMKKHELLHTRGQTHECPICGKTFPLKDYLRLHMRSHDQNFPKRIHKKRNVAGPSREMQSSKGNHSKI